jgi:NADH dehydrogenase (ubiquinone) 1 alpha subcomplex subunit 9
MAYLANRGDDMEMRHLKVQFDLGRYKNVFYSPRDIDSVREVIADADVVVNMIGKYYESGQPVQTSKFPYIDYQINYSFHDVNVKIPLMLAEICKEMQVDHFVHVSSASASPDSKSEWSRTKYEGELAVKEAYPWATIIRPTQLYGKSDRLTKWFANAAASLNCVPLVDGGRALTQPVYVNDVAQTVLAVCDNPSIFESREIDCFGPSDYSYKELAEFVNDVTEQNKTQFAIPYSWARKLAQGLQYQRDPLFTPDLVDQWTENFLPRMTEAEYAAQEDDATKILTMKDLGIDALPIEKEAFSYLHAYRFGGHFFRTTGYH